MPAEIPQISFGGGWISQSIIERFDLQKYSTAAQNLTNHIVHVSGGASNRAGLEFIAEVKDSSAQTRLIPFRFNELQTYALEFGNNYMRVIKDGGVVLGADPALYELVTPYVTSDLPMIKYRQSNDVVFMVNRLHAQSKLSRMDHDDWSLDTITFQPLQVAPASVTVAAQGTAAMTTWKYRVTAVNDDTREESVVVDGEVTNGAINLNDTDYNKITFPAATGAGEYNIYKEENGLYGYIGRTEELKFEDKNFAPDLNDTPPKLVDPFTGVGDYPGAIGIHEQRTVFGSTTNDPLSTWLSQTGQYENMNISSPSKDTDGISYRLATGQGNEIRHFRSFDDKLFTFTSGVVWSVSPDGDADAITPASKKRNIEDALPCSDVPPIAVRDTILMVSGKQQYGNQVHSLGYNLEKDGYRGSDLTVFAKDLFDGHTIKEWAYLEAPFNLVCCIRDDGKLLVMTYENEHKIFAWTLWETDGEFESICDTSEGQEDPGYFIIKRTINGQTKRYIERLHSRTFTDIEDAFFVDSGLTYDGDPTGTLSGLDHLEGKTVIALCDGNLVEGLVVVGGDVTLPGSFSKIHIGLPYVATMKTLPLVLDKGKGKGLLKAPTKALLRLFKTRGLLYGTNEDALEEFPARLGEAWGDPANLVSEMIEVPITADYGFDNTLTFQSVAGLPQTILSITTSFDVAG